MCRSCQDLSVACFLADDLSDSSDVHMDCVQIACIIRDTDLAWEATADELIVRVGCYL